MIYVVCGLIGAGKTTYARNNFEYVTDYDEIGSKEEQIYRTLQLHKEGKRVAHITCYPTRKELEALEKIQEIRFLWVDTDKNRSMDNVMARGRARDMDDLDRVWYKNQELWLKIMNSEIKFERISAMDEVLYV